MIHLKNDNRFRFILETQKEFNYGHRDYIEQISKDHMKILFDLENDFYQTVYSHKLGLFRLEQILEKKYKRALNRNELI